MTSMGILLKEVRIENVRSIRDIHQKLDKNTVLFGHNNSGKSNFLFAITLALGKTHIEKEDIFFSNENPYSKEKKATIDLYFVPVDDDGKEITEYNDNWTALLGRLIGIDESGSEFFGIRTTFSYDGEVNGYRRIRRCIHQWSDNPQPNGDIIPEKVINSFDCIYMDAQRDISLDISDRRSFWNNRISNIEMPQNIKIKFSKIVKQLNRYIITYNPILLDVRNNLNEIIADGDVTLDLIPDEASKLHRGLEIGINENGTIIPISNMGLGTRSLAVLSSIRTITNSDISNTKTRYCIILAEEPESHLHPSLQRSLVKEFCKIDAQTIITTHSPFFIAKSEIMDLVSCNHNNHGSKYTRLSDYKLSNKENKQLKRVFTERRADALFSEMLILGEGKTETLTTSVYFEKYFNKTVDELNVATVDVGGCNDYRPLLIACSAFNIKWVIISDGETKTATNLAKEVDDVYGTGSFDQFINNKIFILPEGECYEDYLISEGYSEIIESTLMSGKFKNIYNNQKLNKIKENPGSDEKTILSLVLKLDDNKTDYAIPIAKAICEHGQIPKMFEKMLSAIKKELMI